MRLGKEAGLNGACYPTVTAAYHQALLDAEEKDTVFVGGSTYVVADLLSEIKPE